MGTGGGGGGGRKMRNWRANGTAYCTGVAGRIEAARDEAAEPDAGDVDCCCCGGCAGCCDGDDEVAEAATDADGLLFCAASGTGEPDPEFAAAAAAENDDEIACAIEFARDEAGDVSADPPPGFCSICCCCCCLSTAVRSEPDDELCGITEFGRPNADRTLPAFAFT